MSHEEIMSDLQSPKQNENLDLVSVVRCKDCKDWHVFPCETLGLCRRECWDDDTKYRLKVETYSTDYCSYGEKIVEVVRCKDCKHCHHTIDARSVDGMIEIDAWECSKLKRKMLPEDYCSYGERRDG